MRAWKIFLSLGLVIFFIGLGVFIAGLAFNGWKIDKNFEMNTYACQEENGALNLSLAAGEMNVQFYDGETIEVDYPTAYHYRYNVEESGGKLTVAPAHNRIFFGWLPFFKFPTVTVRIPQGKVVDLSLNVSAGKADVRGGEFGAFNLNVSAGSVNVNDVKCLSFTADVSAGSTNAGYIDCPVFKLDVSAGSMNVTVKGIKSEYTVVIDKSAGSCNLSGQSGSATGKLIDIDLSAGSVNFGFND